MSSTKKLIPQAKFRWYVSPNEWKESFQQLHLTPSGEEVWVDVEIVYG